MRSASCSSRRRGKNGLHRTGGRFPIGFDCSYWGVPPGEGVAGVGVAGAGVLGAGAAPVVVDELDDVGVLAVVGTGPSVAINQHCHNDHGDDPDILSKAAMIP
jgi:hypothetical protein